MSLPANSLLEDSSGVSGLQAASPGKRAEPWPPHDPAPPPAVAPAETPASLGAHRRILIIDDNRAIQEDFRKILAGSEANEDLDRALAAVIGAERPCPRAPFELDFALQGREGVERVRQASESGRPYALAFVDVRMPPGWDGIETVSRIWEVSPDVQIVVCTAYSDYSWEEMIAKLGQSDRLVILKKPFDNIEVLQLASALTEKWRLLQQVRGQITGLEQMVDARTVALSQSREQFRLIAENVADLIAVLDRPGQPRYLSPSYEKALGRSRGELLSGSLLARIHPDDAGDVAAGVNACFLTGAQQVLEFRLQHQDGSWRVFDSHTSMIPNAQGEPEQLIMVSRDITERKKAEQDKERMEAQLRQAQKLEAIGQLAAGIAHEINTPTQFVGDNIHFLQESWAQLLKLLDDFPRLADAARNGTPAPALGRAVTEAMEAMDFGFLRTEIPKALEQSLDGIQRVSKIVQALKSFSHPGGEQRTQLDLNRAIENTLTVCRNEWKYVAELVTALDPALPPVSCRPGQISQVILNLIVNAAHAIAEATNDAKSGLGRITVTTRQVDGWAEVRVADTGVGIPEPIRHRMFELFFTTKPAGKGTGQGLALARSMVVDNHGGTITFESEVGRGTTFIVRLPLNPPTPAQNGP